MTDAASQQNEALEALQAFNTAITTTRLYPAEAPQVPAAVEKAYQAIKSHLRKSGELVFSIEDGENLLCGHPIQKQTLGKLHGADVFKHLKLLDLNYTIIRPGIDRKTFKKILCFFTTSLQKIKKEGGGLEYADQIGISDVFPTEYKMAVEEKPEEDPEKVLHTFSSSFSEIPERWIVYLSGSQGDQETGREIVEAFKDRDRAAAIITTCVLRALQEIWTMEIVELSPIFEHVLQNVDELLSRNQKEEVALKTADLLLQGLKGPILGILVAQSFTGLFGEALFLALMARIDNEAFQRIIGFLREREKAYHEKFGSDSKQFNHVTRTCARLLDTARGRQYLALEKARAIMDQGEVERRKRRIQAGLNAILQGQVSVLENEELVAFLPQTVERLLAKGKEDVAALLIEKLAKELLKGNEKIEAQLSRGLGRIGDTLVQAGKWDWLEKLSAPLLRWVKEAEQADAAFEEIVTVLNRVMRHDWQVGRNKLADQIANIVFSIRSGIIPKSKAVRDVVGRIQDKSVDKAFLTSLFEKCLADPADELVGQRLSMQGPVAARFLIGTLLHSENAGERIRVLDLLANMGSVLPQVIIEQLPEPMPWFGKRNLLKLLAETGDEEHMEAALAYLGHEDLRVQREAFVCLYKISGKHRKRALLSALSLAGETMKIQVVKALSSLIDDEVVESLIELLDDQENFSADVRGPLIQQICRTLGHSSSQEGLEALERFSTQHRKSAKKLDPSVWVSVESAIQQIRDRQCNRDNRVVGDQLREYASQSFPLKDLEGEPLITNLPEERQILAYLEQGNKTGAKLILTELIGKTARLRQFIQAEKLREWLIEIDPMALTDIIQAAELIENEKTASIDKDHLETWFGLYDVLTTEEFNALYYAFEHKTYQTEELIVKQGVIKPALFFINSGRVKLYYKEEDAETLVKVSGRGEVIGASSFFSASVWTINVAAMGSTELSVLDWERTEGWQKDHPALESKLQDFCIRFDGLKDFFIKTGKDRRETERVQLSGRITSIVLDRHGKDTGITSKGDLTDISAGGVSFFIHISQKQNARLLLGRNVRVVLPTESISSGKLFRVEGVIVAVFAHRVMQNEYSAHVSFDHPLQAEDLQGIINALSQE